MTEQQRRRLIVICGPSGSGRTTLADAVSRELHIACPHEDAIKAALHDVGITTPHSYEIFRTLAEQQLANRVDLILEATFHGPDAPDLLRRWQRTDELDLTTVVCSAADGTRRMRILARPRHPAHAEADRQQLQDPGSTTDHTAFPGRLVLVDTDHPSADTLRSALTQSL